MMLVSCSIALADWQTTSNSLIDVRGPNRSSSLTEVGLSIVIDYL
jgi:hypothetical protein